MQHKILSYKGEFVLDSALNDRRLICWEYFGWQDLCSIVCALLSGSRLSVLMRGMCQVEQPPRYLSCF